MTKAEQNRLMEDLRQVEHSMKPADLELYRRLQSRHKEDEDFDAAARERLERLHRTYKPPVSKEEREARWKAMFPGSGEKS